MLQKRLKKLLLLVAIGQLLVFSSVFAKEKYTANECFEGVSRATLKFNMGLDKALFHPPPA